MIDAHPRIGESAVVAREDSPGERILVAYFVGAGDDDELREDLIEWSRSRLPNHMVPAAFVRLERIPLTASNKLDLKALPVPSREGS